MSYSYRQFTTVPLQDLSLDFATYSALSYLASEMNIPLNEAIGLALKDWLSDAGHPVDRMQN